MSMSLQCLQMGDGPEDFGEMRISEFLFLPPRISHLLSLFPVKEDEPRDDNVYPRGCCNPQRLSASLVRAKTQQNINYDSSQMVSHSPRRHAYALRGSGEGFLAAAESSPCIPPCSALCSAHAAPSPPGKKGFATENDSVFATRGARKQGLRLSRNK